MREGICSLFSHVWLVKKVFNGFVVCIVTKDKDIIKKYKKLREVVV